MSTNGRGSRNRRQYGWPPRSGFRRVLGTGILCFPCLLSRRDITGDSSLKIERCRKKQAAAAAADPVAGGASARREQARRARESAEKSQEVRVYALESKGPAHGRNGREPGRSLSGCLFAAPLVVFRVEVIHPSSPRMMNPPTFSVSSNHSRKIPCIPRGNPSLVTLARTPYTSAPQ